MSLHGTLETFALPDVLALLAATKKTGELRVVGGSVDGRVWFDSGHVVATDVGASTAVVDAVFDLLRLTSGKFSFDADRPPSNPGEPVALDAVLGEAQTRLEEWRSIEAVVPSVAHAVRLIAEVSDPHVMVTGDQWRALVAVASAPTVSGVMDRLQTGEFGTCRMLKDLVGAGLIAIADPPPAPAPKPRPAVQATPAPAPAQTPAPAPAAAPAPEPVSEQPAPAAPAPVDLPAPSAPVAEEPEVAAESAPAPAPVEVAAVKQPVEGSAKAKIAAHLSTPASTAVAVDTDQPIPVPASAKPVKAKVAKEAPEATADGPVGLLEKTVDTPTPKAADAPAKPAAKVPAASPAPAEAAVAEAPVAEATPPSDGEGDGEEPINRGLLLKFLSSVRT